MNAMAQIQIRCAGCNRRLGDYVNEAEAGMVVLELKCPRCGQPHTTIIRPLAARPGISSKADDQTLRMRR